MKRRAELPATLPASARSLLAATLARLRGVPGIEAIVLGGSWARGTQRPDSDLDVGLYYRGAAPFDIGRVRQVANAIAEGADPIVTDFYECGPWVNGGAWIPTRSRKLDLLYRNLDDVERVIEESARGISRSHYEQQPAYGFYSVIYLGETATCIPLSDPTRRESLAR